MGKAVSPEKTLLKQNVSLSFSKNQMTKYVYTSFYLLWLKGHTDKNLFRKNNNLLSETDDKIIWSWTQFWHTSKL